MIHYGHQSLSDSDFELVLESLKGEYLTNGPLLEEFESKLNHETDAHCIAVSSGTAALHTAYSAIGVTSGDEVITPPITFIATQATAVSLGATIKFVDVDPDTGLLDVNQVEKAISKKTKAIVTVDYGGCQADLFKLKAIASKYGIYLIQDAAHSLGSLYFGKKVGSIADLTTFSFFPTKNITTGEGGAVSVLDPEIFKKAKRFARQGLIRNSEEFLIKDEGPWHQEVHSFGLNYRLSEINCALGISQLGNMRNFKARKNEIFDFYTDALADIAEIRLPKVPLHCEPNWHLYFLLVDPDIRLGLYEFLKESGIGVQVNYLPAYRHPAFDGRYPRNHFPNSEAFYSRELSIPLHASLSNAECEYIVDKIRDFSAKI